MFLVLPLFLSFQFFLACTIKASTYEVVISKKIMRNAKYLILLTCSRRKEVILSLSFKSTAPCSAAYDNTTSSNSNGLTVLRGNFSSWNWDPWMDKSPTCLGRASAFAIVSKNKRHLYTWVLLLLALNWWPPNFQAALWNSFCRRRSQEWSYNHAHGPIWQVA